MATEQERDQQEDESQPRYTQLAWSPTYFDRICRAAGGLTPTEWVRQMVENAVREYESGEKGAGA